MTSSQFKEFVRTFKSRHGNRVSAVEMQITKTLIHCVTPIGHSNHQAEKFVIDGFVLGAYFHFRLMRNDPLFEMLCSAATASDLVELSVLQNSLSKKLHMFRFSRCNTTNAFYYVEKEPHPSWKGVYF